MGSFSFYRADRSTKKANFVTGVDKMKLLIPHEFVEHYGAESFCVAYHDYGRLEVTKPTGETVELDVYGFLAYVNRDMEYNGATVKDSYEVSDDGWADTCVQDNRCIGITLGCYAKDMVKCKYPLKLVSASYRGKYEDVPYFSTSDGKQGWGAEYWDGAKPYDTKTVREYCDENCRVR